MLCVRGIPARLFVISSVLAVADVGRFHHTGVDELKVSARKGGAGHPSTLPWQTAKLGNALRGVSNQKQRCLN